MTSPLIKLFELSSAAERTRASWLLVAALLLAVLEMVSVASIFPFLHLLSDPEAVRKPGFLNTVYAWFGYTEPGEAIVFAGAVTVISITAANCVAVFVSWRKQKMAWGLAHSLSTRLAHQFTVLPYHYFMFKDLGDLLKSSIEDVNRIINGVVIAGAEFITQILICTLIFLALAIIRPDIAFAALALFGGLYVLIFFVRRAVVRSLGQQQVKANSKRYRSFVDLVKGIKTIQSHGAGRYFLRRFREPSAEFAKIYPLVDLNATVPRFLIESIGIVVIVLAVVFSQRSGVPLESYIATLSLFAIAAYRVMPALNKAYVALTLVNNNLPAVDSVYDIAMTQSLQSPNPRASLPRDGDLVIDGLSYRYAGGDADVLTNVNLTVASGAKVGVVGPSGAGKTSLIDLVVGVLTPKTGNISFAGTIIGSHNMQAWQAMCGYVPQDVFLFDETVARNVAFGDEKIHEQRLIEACRLAQLHEFITQNLKDGYNTRIGEGGVRLSGGQRQRIGLARALYRRPAVLVLDEATSALDSKTEKRVMDAIFTELPDTTVIIIAHRLSTVHRCEKLFLVQEGSIASSGNYEELLESSSLFRDLVLVH